MKLDPIKRGDMVFLHNPYKEKEKVRVCFATKNHIMITFGTFARDTMKWICDDRFYITQE